MFTLRRTYKESWPKNVSSIESIFELAHSASSPGFVRFQAFGTACCLRDLAWHPNQHVLALAGYGPDSPILLYYSEATADNQTEVMKTMSRYKCTPVVTRRISHFRIHTENLSHLYENSNVCCDWSKQAVLYMSAGQLCRGHAVWIKWSWKYASEDVEIYRTEIDYCDVFHQQSKL